MTLYYLIKEQKPSNSGYEVYLKIINILWAHFFGVQLGKKRSQKTWSEFWQAEWRLIYFSHIHRSGIDSEWIFDLKDFDHLHLLLYSGRCLFCIQEKWSLISIRLDNPSIFLTYCGCMSESNSSFTNFVQIVNGVLDSTMVYTFPHLASSKARKQLSCRLPNPFHDDIINNLKPFLFQTWRTSFRVVKSRKIIWVELVLLWGPMMGGCESLLHMFPAVWGIRSEWSWKLLNFDQYKLYIYSINLFLQFQASFQLLCPKALQHETKQQEKCKNLKNSWWKVRHLAMNV